MCQRIKEIVHIPLLMLAYRTTPQESTRISSYKMMFAREAALPIDLLLERPQTHKSLLVYPCEYVHELRKKIEDSIQLAREHLKSCAERQKRLYDRKVSGKAFNTGDEVWLLITAREKGLSPKLQEKWQGPYKVVRT